MGEQSIYFEKKYKEGQSRIQDLMEQIQQISLYDMTVHNFLCAKNKYNIPLDECLAQMVIVMAERDKERKKQILRYALTYGVLE